MQANQPIGIFDSGIGGLTVANAIRQVLPNEQIVYFGDTAHLPYGDKEPYSIKHYSTEIAKFLLKQNCKVIVMACHTASSNAFKEVVDTVKGKAIVINVVDPVINYLKRNQNKVIGVIGTKGTINSGIYENKVKEENINKVIKTLATPLLCPMIEEGFINDQISHTVIQSYLEDKRIENIDAIVLACTHYPLIKKEINEFYNSNVEVIDSSEVVAEFLNDELSRLNLLNTSERMVDQFYVSDYTESFEKSTRFFFKESIRLEKGSIWS